MTWLHDTHHLVADTVEIVALTKTDPTIVARPGAAGDRRSRWWPSDAEAHAALAPFRSNPALDRALMVLDAVPTTIAEQRKRQIEDNPEGHRWAVDNAWLSGSAAEVVPAMRRAYTTLPHAKAFTIWFSMAPLRDAARHGVLAPVGDLPGVVRLLGRRVGRRALPGLARGAMADLEPVTVGQYLGDSDLSRRQVQFMSDESWARLQEIRAERDPDGLFVGYLAGPRRSDQPQPLGGATRTAAWLGGGWCGWVGFLRVWEGCG